jgi:hypothetical protein
MSITSVANDLVTSVSVINALKPLPPTISGYSVGGVDDTALDPAGGQTVQINGTGFLAGATITFDGSAVAVVTYVNPNQLTFTSPAKSAGTYTIYVVNADGGTAIYIPGIIYSVLPTWTTSAGTLGSYYETTSISNTVVASGDAPITYSLFSGSLPTGSTLYANGVITGTAPVDSSSTTYSFTIQATDAQLQDSTRSFSLTINVDAVTWVTPANATTYTNAVDSVIANVALSATDAAGYAVSYSANALPTGLTLTGSNIAGTPTVIADSSTLLTATAATTNRSAVRTINWSITVAGDVYFEYNTLLIPGASTTFVDDASTNNFAVTIAGDTKPNSMNPYTPGYYSNYFDGTGDYLTVADNAAFIFGTGNFTIECWINTSSTTGTYGKRVVEHYTYTVTDYGWNLGVLRTAGNTISFDSFTSGTVGITLGTSNTLTANVWHHVAVVRSGSTASLYLDGTRVATQSGVTWNDTNTIPAGLEIGSQANIAGTIYDGYISNLRIVKGTAVYDPTLTTLTVPTSPLTAISNTSILTCQSNRLIDNSTNTFTITRNGDTSIKSFQPFTPNSSYSLYGSGYFDGTGDSIYSNVSAAGTGSFTYEAWVYPLAFASNKTIFRTDDIGSLDISLLCNSTGQLLSYDNPGTLLASTTTTLQLNTWAYVALVRNGTAMQIYINGVESRTGGSGTFSNNITYTQLDIGGRSYYSDESWNGYITDARYTKSAVYTTAFTPPSEPLTAIANTSLLTLQNNQSVNNSVFLDNSTNNFLVTRNGNTTQGTFSPYGGNWCNYFNGTTDYISLPANAKFNQLYSATPFTIEFWTYPTAYGDGSTTTYGARQIVGTAGSNGTYGWRIEIGVANIVFAGQAGTPLSTPISLNQWTHIAISWNGTTATMYKNGTSVASSSASWTNTSDALLIGLAFPGTSGYYYWYSGYISNLRIVNGTAVYTGAFTPPTTPLTVTQAAGTNIAAITNGATGVLTCQSNRFIDTSINAYTVTVYSTPTIQRFSPFNPSSLTPTSYSGYFDGSGDYLNAPSNAVFGFGTGDFTIEGWFYFTGTIGTYQRPWWFGDDNDNIEINASVLRVGGASQGTLITGGTTIVSSTWYHIALTRASGSYKLWLNGSQQGSTATNSYNSSARTFTTMATSSGVQPSTGYVSNLRIVKGVAVYTGAFTPPTSPLAATQTSGTNIAAITGTSTSLLTCQSTNFIDNSTNNFTITAAGNSQPTQQNPFGYTSATTQGYTASTIGGSGYFDGSGYSNLVLPSNASLAMGTGNFTIEFWINTSNIAQTGYVLQTDTSPNTLYISLSGSTIRLTNQSTPFAVTPTLLSNTWYHIAVMRSGTSSVIYTNGVAGTAVTCSIDFTQAGPSIGNNSFIGYLSDCRIVKGTALYTSNFVPPSAPLTAIQNTTLLTNMTSAGVYDAAMMNNMETVGDAKLSTAVSKFGGTSMSFDGTGDYILLNSVGSNALYAFGTGDFTIECWVYLNALACYIYDGRPASTNGAQPTIYTNGSGVLYYFTNVANQITGSTLSLSTWYHIALSRSGTSTKMFVNGIQVGSTYTDSTSYTNTAARPVIGIDGYSLSNQPFNGYLDDLRITKGLARYTANFSAPTTSFPIY